MIFSGMQTADGSKKNPIPPAYQSLGIGNVVEEGRRSG